MLNSNARRVAAIAFVSIAWGNGAVAQRGESQAAGAAVSEVKTLTGQHTMKWSLCGPGQFDLIANGTKIGTETFDITCKADGSYSATGQTKIAAGATNIDLTTKLELGSDLIPVSASAKGTAQGQPLEQTISFANGTATVTANGQSQTVAYSAGAAWLANNVFYANMFIAARYDETKQGAQEIPIFPKLAATLTQSGGVGWGTAPPAKSGGYNRLTMKIAGQSIDLWKGDDERFVGVTIQAQQFAAVAPSVVPRLPMLFDADRVTPPGAAASNAPEYAAPAGASFTAEEVKIPVATYALAGTLLLPKASTRPAPAVVMITGSGLQTRDSRIAMPGLEQYAPFRQIAERLAGSGVAVLRADDRGTGGSTGRETLQHATTTSLSEDTRAQIAWLRARKEIDPDRIILIGHSEGASIATMIAATDPRLAAIVLMAGAAKRGADIAIEQHEDMVRSDTTMTEATREEMRAKQRDAVKTILAGGEVPGQPVNAWIKEYFVYDPLPAVRKVKQPILIVQGERDRQIAEAHASMLADAARGAGNKRVALKVFPTLNHLFLPAKTGSFNEYSRLETTVVPAAVIDSIDEWIRATIATR